jgi:hypothetical protein
MEDGAEGVGLSREERFADSCLEKGESLGEGGMVRPATAPR